MTQTPEEAALANFCKKAIEALASAALDCRGYRENCGQWACFQISDGEVKIQEALATSESVKHLLAE